MNSQENHCREQKHVHEITGSTGLAKECCKCHNHRFCAVSGEAIPIPGKQDHFHEVKFRTDFDDNHFHEFCGKTSGAICVGNGKHIHFIKACTEKADGHRHEFQVAALIDNPTEFKCDDQCDEH